MILICTEANDFSTTQVIKWINYYGAKYIRYNWQDKIRIIKTIGLNDFLFEIESQYGTITLKFSDITAYWYRRGGINLAYDILDDNTTYAKNINQYLAFENSSLLGFMEALFEEKTIHKIGKRNFNAINKLQLLQKAKEIGLDVPETLIATKKEDVLDFYEKHKKHGIITKDIRFPLNIKISENSTGTFFTSEFTHNQLEGLSDTFFATKFQEKLDKEFEIRTFFLNNKTYSSAIFSQDDEQTKIDFRRYNFSRPNRTPPYNLPGEIEAKLLQLMAFIGLNSGSVDMVYTKDSRFVFLEVNPIGQFHQVSHPCNYHLEKLIANYLIYGKQ